MSEVGISDIAIYIPQFYLPYEELAKACGIPKEKYQVGLGNQNMSVIPNYEDAVTMAANSAIQLLEKSGTDPDEIRELVVSTESGVDHSKPVASFVQGLLGLGTRCRVYEIKHACYGGTAGLVNSIDKISIMNGKSDKALVIMTDIAKYGFGSPGESTQGAGAIALLVEKNPTLFSINTSLNGVYSKDVFDFWRPTGHRVPVVDGKYSIECYLTALREAVSHFRSNSKLKQGELMEKLDYIVYHLPYCNMAKKAHRYFTDLEYEGLNKENCDTIYSETFRQKVAPGLLGAREVGNIYTGSVYMSLISLMESEKANVERKSIGLFSYGSGCGAEFMLCHVKSPIDRIIKNLKFTEQLKRRKKISFEQYTQIYSKSAEEIFYYLEEAKSFKDQFTKFVFTGFEGHKRMYI